jgi:hypothetical protein
LLRYGSVNAVEQRLIEVHERSLPGRIEAVDRDGGARRRATNVPLRMARDTHWRSLLRIEYASEQGKRAAALVTATGDCA